MHLDFVGLSSPTIVYRVSDACKRAAERTVCDVSNAVLNVDFAPRAENAGDLPVRYYVVPGGTVRELLNKLDEVPIPAAGLDAVCPEQFVDRLCRHHELDMEGRHRVARTILGESVTQQ